MKMEIAKMLLSVVFICLVIFGPCQSTKNYIGEHRELSIRSDRTGESGKQNGGGVCFYFNQLWANKNNIHVKKQSVMRT